MALENYETIKEKKAPEVIDRSLERGKRKPREEEIYEAIREKKVSEPISKGIEREKRKPKKEEKIKEKVKLPQQLKMLNEPKKMPNEFE